MSTTTDSKIWTKSYTMSDLKNRFIDSLLRSKGTVKFLAKPEKNRGKGSSSKEVKESRCWSR